MEIKELTVDELETIVRDVTMQVFFEEETGENFDVFTKQNETDITVYIVDKMEWRMPFKKNTQIKEFKSILVSFFNSIKDKVLYGEYASN